MPFPHKVTLGDHPEINTFYDDVAGLKRGGRRHKKARKPAAKDHSIHIHNKNVVYEKISKMKRLVAPPQLARFANAPAVQSASYFAVPPAVGQSYNHQKSHEPIRQVDAVRDAQHLPVKGQYNVISDSNPKGIEPVDANRHRATASDAGVHGGNMANDPRRLAATRHVMAEYNLEAEQAARELRRKQFSNAMDHADHVVLPPSHNYFPPTGAPGNHPAPKMAQHNAPRSGFEPLEAQAPASRNQVERMESQIQVGKPPSRGPRLRNPYEQGSEAHSVFAAREAAKDESYKQARADWDALPRSSASVHEISDDHGVSAEVPKKKQGGIAHPVRGAYHHRAHAHSVF
jgi:hypothetical protein